jgi:hypothetical protein
MATTAYWGTLAYLVIWLYGCEGFTGYLTNLAAIATLATLAILGTLAILATLVTWQKWLPLAIISNLVSWLQRQLHRGQPGYSGYLATMVSNR